MFLPDALAVKGTEYESDLDSAPIHSESGGMANKPSRLSAIDSFISRATWVWERIWTVLLSGTGAWVMGALAKATAAINALGPIAWGGIGFATFVGLYVLFLVGTRVLADARKRRAEADFADRLADRSTINPLSDHFVGVRINLSDLYTPFGDPLKNYTFKRCELIGPAVIFMTPATVFRRNLINNVEFIRINPQSGQLWPNKLVLHAGLIEECTLHNVILLVADWQADDIASTFNHPIQWMNDEPNEV